METILWCDYCHKWGEHDEETCPTARKVNMRNMIRSETLTSEGIIMACRDAQNYDVNGPIAIGCLQQDLIKVADIVESALELSYADTITRQRKALEKLRRALNRGE